MEHLLATQNKGIWQAKDNRLKLKNVTLLDQLNPAQKEAVVYDDGHLLIVAGAGSGKTRALTRKIAYLINDCGVAGSGILAMTFSNKAAGEMRERIAQLVPPYDQPHWIGTFHSMCLRILREFGQHIDIHDNFSIYDDSDQLSAIKHALNDLNLDPKKISPKLIRYHIAQAKNETVNILPYIETHYDLEPQVIEVIRRYQLILRQNQALDFGDLLGATVHLLSDVPQVRKRLQERWQRLLIDEYQDTNEIQKQLIKLLAGSQAKVCAVGDEDQSIYGWRGARVENMLEFPDDFPGAKTIKLEQNYRSTQNILAAANDVIQNNVGRRQKVLWTDNQEGEVPEHFHAEDDYGEAIYVLDQVEKLCNSGIQANEVAIFYRTHAQSRLIEEECRRRNQSYRVLGGTKFFDRKEIKDILSYLSLLNNPADNVAFMRIINSPARGIGKASLLELNQIALNAKQSLYDSIPFLQGKRRAFVQMKRFHQWFETLRIEIEQLSLLELVENVLASSGYLSSLEEEQTIEADARLENIQELLRSIDEFSNTESDSLNDYLAKVSLVAETDKLEESTDASIVLMTIHNSKGLEYDAVFIVGMEEGIFPHARSIDSGDPGEIEEERRLCYVAMTRARQKLILSSATRRFLYKNTQYNPASRFISEISSRHLLDVSPQNASHSLYDETDATHSPFRPSRSFWNASHAKDSEIEVITPYREGRWVAHPKFGKGSIQKVEGTAPNLKITILFADVGLKKIMLNYCPLEIIDA